MKKLLSALFICLLSTAAYPQAKTKTVITNEVSTNMADNTTGAITPAILRNALYDIINSYWDLGGAQVFICPTHTWIASGNVTAGATPQTCTQPAASDLSNGTTGSGAVVLASGSTIINVTITGTTTATNNTLVGGANVTSFSLGTLVSGNSITINCGQGPLQYATNGGLFTLSAPSNDGSCDIQLTNNASAGAVTFSGFTVNSSYTGAAIATTNTSKYFLHIERINGSSIYIVIPQQ